MNSVIPENKSSTNNVRNHINGLYLIGINDCNANIRKVGLLAMQSNY